MKKQKIQLILLAIVLLLLVGLYLLVKKTDIFKEEEVKKETFKLIDANMDDVVGISYQYEGEDISIVKSGDQWIYEKDPSVDLDEDKVSDMIDNATSINSDTKIEAGEDLSGYGLLNPANTITLTLTDGSSQSYYIGDQEKMSYKYYAKSSRDNNIYLVSSIYSSSVAKSIDSIKVEEATENSED